MRSHWSNGVELHRSQEKSWSGRRKLLRILEMKLADVNLFKCDREYHPLSHSLIHSALASARSDIKNAACVREQTAFINNMN